MSLRLRSRLQTLERGIVSVHGCPACRQRRDRIALVDITQNSDGNVLLLTTCRRFALPAASVPELVVEVVAAVVDSTAVACDSAPEPSTVISEHSFLKVVIDASRAGTATLASDYLCSP